jgi:hypothetical protein
MVPAQRINAIFLLLFEKKLLVEPTLTSMLVLMSNLLPFVKIFELPRGRWLMEYNYWKYRENM